MDDIDQSVLENYLQKAKEAGRISFGSTDPKAVMTKLGLAEGDRHCGEGWNQAHKQDFSEKGPEKGPESKNDEMRKRCEAVLQLIRENSKISRPLLARELGLTEKQARAAVDRLKTNGKLYYEGVGRGGHWVVKE